MEHSPPPLGRHLTLSSLLCPKNTPHEHRLLVHASIIDTPTYDILLGMEFIRATRGVYDSYTELFTYRYFGSDGRLKSSSLSAPCHTSTPLVVAAAFMVGLIDEAAELLDVQGTADDQIPKEEEDKEVGYHAAPHQMAAIRLHDAAIVVRTTPFSH